MRKKQRLALCLDGTWNNMDDSTNVFHQFALIPEGDVAAGGGTVCQKKYYHLGVGTGPLDRITGGGFGFGIEQNVRNAYNWLVQHYQDASEGVEADEIYVFGFSRGAYTARSLVGFISRCGLLRRGAPLTVRQLWQAYCLIGRQRERRRSVWDWWFGEDTPEIREISELVCDPWEICKKAQNESPEIPGLRVPGQNLRETERLLVHWSRRVKITYLGVYDTVGAIGWDALAIPGLTSKLALHHNMRPTRLIQKCRHALAIDEHRSVFNHTPFMEYIGHQRPEGGTRPRAVDNDEARAYWLAERDTWRRRIEQRWFVGAHSNIGGGYPNNELAMVPFRWIFDGAKQAGLVLNGMLPWPTAPKARPVDSYLEFARPLWAMILRAKRNFRRMDPEPEVRASRRKVKQPGNPPPGFSLASINEQVDETVFDHWNQTQDCAPPPNLVSYAERALANNPPPENASRLNAIRLRTPGHDWPGGGWIEEAALVVWATLGACGLSALTALAHPAGDASLPLWLLCLAALGLSLIDWLESRTNFALALGGRAPWRRAVGDSLYWLRAFGVVLFAMGGMLLLAKLGRPGWHAGLAEIVSARVDPFVSAIFVATSAALGVLAGKFFDRVLPIKRPSCASATPHAGMPPPKRAGWRFPGWLSGVVVVAAGIPAVAFCASAVKIVLAPVLPSAGAMAPASGAAAAFGGAGLLLILQWAVGYLVSAFEWVGEPLSKANLRSIIPLQLCWSPKGAHQCLEEWRRMLVCHWNNDDEDAVHGPAARSMREFVREALWRDVIGFIPIYFSVFVLGLWFAATELSWDWLRCSLSDLPLWLMLPLATAVADYAEDACHLRYLAIHAKGKEPGWLLTIPALAAACIKSLGFLTACALVLAAVAQGSCRCALPDAHAGWRGTLAVSISALVVAAVIGIVVTWAVRRFRLKRG